MNTAAAFANPLCRKDAGPYGNLDFVVEGGGPVCVAEWKDGADNGGATYQGVTKDSIDVVVLVPNEQQLAGAAAGTEPDRPRDRRDGHGHERVQGHVRGVRAPGAPDLRPEDQPRVRHVDR